MSVSTVIKNTILVIMIILIGHFVVKNMLVERGSVAIKTIPQSGEISKEPVKDITVSIPLSKDTQTKPNMNDDKVISKPSSAPVEMVTGGLDKAKEELLKFINDDDELEKFYENEKVQPFVPTDNCKSKEQTQSLLLSTTCDPAIQDLKYSEPPQMDVTANCNITQDKRNLMILKEYDNENMMNGGSLYGGLSAFDTFDNNYQAYCP